MSRRLAVFTALFLSSAALGAPLAARAAPDPMTITDADRKEFHEAVTASSTMRELMEADPAGFKAFEDGVMNDLAAGKIDENGARKRGYDFATAARAKMMGALSKAPDDAYLAFVGVQLSAMKTLGRYNTRACYEFVEGGGISEDTASTLGPDLLPEIEKVGHAQVAAAKAGARTPVTRVAASETEGQAVVQTYSDLGGDLAWLKAMGDKTTESFTSESRCENAVKWVDALLKQPKSAAVRLMLAD